MKIPENKFIEFIELSREFLGRFQHDYIQGIRRQDKENLHKRHLSRALISYNPPRFNAMTSINVEKLFTHIHKRVFIPFYFILFYFLVIETNSNETT